MFKFFGVGTEEKQEVMNESSNPQEIEEKGDAGQVALDIVETKDAIFIIAPIAGVELEDIDVSLNKNLLTIRGHRAKPDIYSELGAEIRNSECFWGEFIRNVILPENLDFDSVKAQMDDNLLIITLQKLRFNTREIKIDRVED